MTDQDETLARFNSEAAADLYSPRRPGSARPLNYQRFTSASEAIRFAVEGLPAAVLLGTYLEVEDQRYGAQEIRQLYELGRWHQIGETNVPR